MAMILGPILDHFGPMVCLVCSGSQGARTARDAPIAQELVLYLAGGLDLHLRHVHHLVEKGQNPIETMEKKHEQPIPSTGLIMISLKLMYEAMRKPTQGITQLICESNIFTGIQRPKWESGGHNFGISSTTSCGRSAWFRKKFDPATCHVAAIVVNPRMLSPNAKIADRSGRFVVISIISISISM